MTGSNCVSTLLDHTAFLIVSLAMVDSLHFVFARLLLAHFSPGVSTFYVTAISTLEMAVIGFLWGEMCFKNPVQEHLVFSVNRLFNWGKFYD
jgi:hypothetical protein